MTFRQLLRMNVDIDTQLKRKFDFNIWINRSLEHIQPKSKDEEVEEWTEETSVHCIGNLVLLDKNDNSAFGAKSFTEKKKVFFKIDGKLKQSLSLLHSISVFSEEKWTLDEIKKAKEAFIQNFQKTYKLNNDVNN